MAPPSSSSSNPSGSYLEQTVSLLGSVSAYMRLPALVSTGAAAVLTSLLYFKQKSVPDLELRPTPRSSPTQEIEPEADHDRSRYRSLIYPAHMPPNARTDIPRPPEYGIKDFEELTIPTHDGEKLSAFYIRARKGGRNSNCTVLMFHGNAGNIGHRLPIARMLINYIGCNVFMLEYRGYGLSTGDPDEKGLMIDAQTALEYLRDRAETSQHKIVVYGQSLGGAVSIKLVAKNQNAGDIVGLILENTFLSMRSLIPSVIPPAKYLTLLCHQVWPSENVIPTITEVPILFLSGQQDEIVPPPHMRKLYELATTPTKIWKPLPAGDHNSSVLEEGYFEAISDFVCNVGGDEIPEKKRRR